MSAFGVPPASSSSTTGATPAPSLFGNIPAATSNSAASGTASTGTTNIFGGGTFGAAANAPKPGIFGTVGSAGASGGAAGATAATGGAFGGLTSTPNAFGSATGAFGGGASTSTPGAPGAGTGGGLLKPSVFGSGAPATPTPSAAPAASAFGTTGTGGTMPTPSLFGGGAAVGPGAGSSNPNPLFGGATAASSSKPNPLAGPGVGASTNTFFGGGAAAGAGASTSTSNPLFGGGVPAAGTAGATPTANPLFGGGAAASTPTPTLNPNLFGSAPAAGANASKPSIFGMTPNAVTGGANVLKPSLFGATPGISTSSTTTTAPSNFFATPPEKKDAPASGLGILAAAAAATVEQQPSTPAAAPIPNFFGNKDSSSAVAEKKDGTPASTSAFGLFAPKDSGSSAEKKDSTASNNAPTLAFSLGGTASKDGAKPAAPSTTLGAAPPLGSTTVAGATGTMGALGTAGPTSTIAVPPPSVLRGQTIEEIVSRWSTELDFHEREFNKLASEVIVYDRALIENGNNLATLYAHVLAAEREQNDIDQALDHIEQQQKDLAATLEAYEKPTDEILGGRGSNLRALDTGPADTERDKNYMLATELHGHLDDLSSSLTQMIDAVNALALPSASTSGATQDGGEDPMSQIAQILNSHLEGLMWIDGAAREVETKINDVEKRVRAAGEANASSALKSKGFGLDASR